MAPPTLFVYDTAGLTAHFAGSFIGPRLPPAVKPPVHSPKDLDREARQRWEEEGGNSAG
jgi:hypothetical protein